MNTSIEKIADAISVLRRQFERSSKLKGIKHNLSKDNIRRKIFNGLNKEERARIYRSFETGKLPENTVFRGELKDGMGRASLSEDRIKEHLSNGTASRSHKYFSHDPHIALTYTDKKNPTIKYTKINPKRHVFEDEKSNRRSSLYPDISYKENKREKDYWMSRLKDRNKIPTSEERNIKRLKYQNINKPVKFKDLKTHGYSHKELYLNTNVHDLKKANTIHHGNERTSIRDNEGNVLLTRGLRLSDMYKKQ
jgi:hypothetical protein